MKCCPKCLYHGMEDRCPRDGAVMVPVRGPSLVNRLRSLLRRGGARRAPVVVSDPGTAPPEREGRGSGLRSSERTQSDGDPATDSAGLAAAVLQESSDAWSAEGDLVPAQWTEELEPSLEVAPPSAPARFYEGKVLAGRYRIIEKIGKGGMGVVFKAHQRAVDRTVAIKVLPPRMMHGESVVRRFKREAWAASQLRHPNTITIYDFGQSREGFLYLVMEFLDGCSLAQAIKEEGAFPWRRALRIIDQICGSLAEAHAKGIIHRDVKPSNIFLIELGDQPDFVKVLDFGIAKLTVSDPGITQMGALIGSPAYMSPEQIRKERLDPRSDIYSLGIVSYELLTGRPIFDCAHPFEFLTCHRYRVPAPFAEIRPDLAIPPAVEAIVTRMLLKDREQRYQSVKEIREDIAAALARAEEPSAPEPAARAGGRERSRPAVRGGEAALRHRDRAPAARPPRAHAGPASPRGAAPGAASRPSRADRGDRPSPQARRAGTPRSPASAGPRSRPSPSPADAWRSASLELFGDEGSAEDEARTLDRMIDEIDAFIRVGLVKMALEHLRRIFAQDPRNRAALERARAIYSRAEAHKLAPDERLWLAGLVGHEEPPAAPAPAAPAAQAPEPRAARAPELKERSGAAAVHERPRPRLPGARPRSEPAPSPPAPAAPVVPPDMVLVPEITLDSFWDGRVTVARFLMDRTPVTNREYFEFVKATREVPPLEWYGREPPRDRLDHPVVGVSLIQARRFAQWKGKRLPTNLEWEAAVRAPDGRPYPWGSEWDPARCNCPEQKLRDTSPVNAYPRGASALGCRDLLGNVWEWTELDPRCQAPEPGSVWVFGGSFKHPCTSGGRFARTVVQAHNQYSYLGFRCAASLPEAR